MGTLIAVVNCTIFPLKKLSLSPLCDLPCLLWEAYTYHLIVFGLGHETCLAIKIWAEQTQYVLHPSIRVLMSFCQSYCFYLCHKNACPSQFAPLVCVLKWENMFKKNISWYSLQVLRAINKYLLLEPVGLRGSLLQQS